MYIKIYYCYIKNININYLKITNNLIENHVDKPTHKKISTLLNYLELKKLY